ncbi:MAG: hypothetical protein IT208_03900 [Chthonomonadales bacterium]|nr:hypothetical protein [Chthonomonadales bacterium]
MTGEEAAPRAFLGVAAQYAVQTEHYASAGTFAEAMGALMRRVVERLRGRGPALVVLPEDIGLGLLLAGDLPALRGARTLHEASARLMERNAEAVATARRRFGLSPTAGLLRALSGERVEPIYRETFAALARRSGVFLCAGSAPIAPDPARGEVYNVSYLFGPDGRLLGAQPKAHLVNIEGAEGLCLGAAAESELRPARLPFATVGTLICYDAFHVSAVGQLARAGADVLLQPSFNNGAWTPEQAAEWRNGLWRALQVTPGLRAGINAMMVGELLGERGEGRSAIVAPAASTPDGSGYLARAASATEEEILVAPIA